MKVGASGNQLKAPHPTRLSPPFGPAQHMTIQAFRREQGGGGKGLSALRDELASRGKVSDGSSYTVLVVVSS